MNAHERALYCECPCHGNPDMRHMVACCDGDREQIASRSAREGQQTPPPAGVASVPTVDAAAVLASHTPMRVENPNWYDGVLEDHFVCFTCRLPWRGDAATGGCDTVLLAREVVALRERAERAEGQLAAALRSANINGDQAERAEARVALLEGLLRSVEWVNTADGETLYCPRCGWTEAEGHAPGCPMGTALADGG